MVTKYLEGTRNLMLENDNPLYLEYYLLETENNNKRTYGVEIIKKQKLFDKDWMIESEGVNCLSESEEIARDIVNKLIGYTVTPITLINVIDELLVNVAS